MESNQRLILTVVLSVLIVVGFQFVAGKLYPPPKPVPAPAVEATAPVAPVPASPAPPSGAAAPVAGSPATPAPAPSGREQVVTLETEDLSLAFGSQGGGLVKAELKGAKSRRAGGGQVDLATNVQGEPLRLFDLVLGGGLPELPARTPCRITGQASTFVTFQCLTQDLSVTRTWSVVGPNRLMLDVSLVSLSLGPLHGTLQVVAPAVVDPEQQKKRGGCSGMFTAPASPTQAICRHGDSVTRRLFDPEEKEKALEGPASFAGIEERYFTAVAVPAQGATCTVWTPTQQKVGSSLVSEVVAAPAKEATLRYEVVIGPKDTQFLAGQASAIASELHVAEPKLETIVDLGFFGAIGRVLLVLMRVFHAALPNWGVAIILLTVFVKVLTFPLAWKSMKSMEEVRKLAPEMEAIKKKYPDDREKQQQETLQLYQKHKVNPLGGCLPMLIQMPIWLALYTVLQTSVELYNAPFIAGWINDLTAKDPIYAMPLAMGVTMFITQRMQPTQMDPAQQKMLQWFMPIFFTMIMLQLPSGLTLYIFTNNILSIGQQLLLRRTMGLPLVGGPVVAAAKTTVAVTPGGGGRKKKGDA